KRLLDVSLLQKKGLKISKISRLDEVQIKKEVEEFYALSLNAPGAYEAQIHELIKAMVELNEPMFEKTFSNSVLKRGLETTMLKVVFPFLVRVGVMWKIGEIHPGQEHFVSNLIKQKLYSAIDGVVLPQGKKPLCILYLIENELHELSLLFAAYLLKSLGKDVLYLGQSIPFVSLKAIVQDRQPDALYTVFTSHKPPSEFQLHLDRISEFIGDANLFIYASPELVNELECADNIRFVKSFEEFLD
ncbi:MAG: helix-turn-helix-type transcriptional regulator, partial [Okeania sp. SIO3C4]|nr:helix-turn-helix-type transcriptional regulator [Okeania sp. SIO3C4]